MKKLFSFTILFFLFCISLNAQRTIDIGGEFQKYSLGSIYNLHMGFNLKPNHSLLLRLGYNQVGSYVTKDGYDHTESGEGWGGGLGYRHYFKPGTKKFFVGATVNVWVMDLDYDIIGPAGPAVYIDKTTVLQPALETGYTFLFNKIFFITPYLSAGFYTDLNTKPTDVKYYQESFRLAIGINAGIRL